MKVILTYNLIASWPLFLVRALEQTGINATLSGAGTFTVMAFDDARFNATFNESTREYLFQPAQKDLLENLLLNHIIGGTFTFEQLISKSPVETLGERPMTLKKLPASNLLFANDVQVLLADQKATNGNINFLDAVILPYGEFGLAQPTIKRVVDTDTSLAVLRNLTEVLGYSNLIKSGKVYTLFAPDEFAFLDFVMDIVRFLIHHNATEFLRGLLQYHLV